MLSLPTLNWLRAPDGETGDGFTPLWPLERLLAAAAGAGFAAVGLDDLTVRDESPARVAELLHRYGLACTDVGVLRVGQGSVEVQAHSLAALAGESGARVCVAALYTPGADAALDDLRTGAALLAETGVRVALEFAPYGGLRRLADAVTVCEAVGWDRCGLLLDSWHFFRTGAPWAALRALDPGQIALVHVNDAPEPVGDLLHESRFRRLPPGEGIFALGAFIAALEEIGYDGAISLEVLSAALRAQGPEAGARALHAAARRVLGPQPRVEMN